MTTSKLIVLKMVYIMARIPNFFPTPPFRGRASSLFSQHNINWKFLNRFFIVGIWHFVTRAVC